ncbi:MAG: hypothetical protein ACXIUD_06230 [Mongoliitalea sp.]
MKRRDFVKVLPVLALSPLVLKEGVHNAKHIIVLGSAATRMFVNHAQDLTVDSITVINDENPAAFHSVQTFFPYEVPESAYFFLGERKFLKKDLIPKTTLSLALKEHLKGLKGTLIVVTALGGYTGTAHYRAIAEFFSIENITSEFICSIPFEFEGSAKVHQSLQLATEIKAFVSQKVFALEYIRCLYGNLSIRSAYAKADEQMMALLKTCW